VLEGLLVEGYQERVDEHVPVAAFRDPYRSILTRIFGGDSVVRVDENEGHIEISNGRISIIIAIEEHDVADAFALLELVMEKYSVPTRKTTYTIIPDDNIVSIEVVEAVGPFEVSLTVYVDVAEQWVYDYRVSVFARIHDIVFENLEEYLCKVAYNAFSKIKVDNNLDDALSHVIAAVVDELLRILPLREKFDERELPALYLISERVGDDITGLTGYGYGELYDAFKRLTETCCPSLPLQKCCLGLVPELVKARLISVEEDDVIVNDVRLTEVLEKIPSLDARKLVEAIKYDITVETSKKVGRISGEMLGAPT